MRGKTAASPTPTELARCIAFGWLLPPTECEDAVFKLAQLRDAKAKSLASMAEAVVAKAPTSKKKRGSKCIDLPAAAGAKKAAIQKSEMDIAIGQFS